MTADLLMKYGHSVSIQLSSRKIFHHRTGCLELVHRLIHHPYFISMDETFSRDKKKEPRMLRVNFSCVSSGNKKVLISREEMFSFMFFQMPKEQHAVFVNMPKEHLRLST